jgi:hypothetical protein
MKRTSLDSDPWVTDRPEGIPTPVQLHALGAVAYIWSICEEVMLSLFCAALDIPPEIEHTMTKDLGDITLMNKLRDGVADRSLRRNVREAIEHACAMYDVCRLNRNALLHARWLLGQGHFSRRHKTTGRLVMVAKGVRVIRRQPMGCPTVILI